MLIPMKCVKCGTEVSAVEISPEYASCTISVNASLSVHICRKPDGSIDKASALSPYRMCLHGIWEGDCPEHDPLKEYAKSEGWKYEDISETELRMAIVNSVSR